MSELFDELERRITNDIRPLVTPAEAPALVAEYRRVVEENATLRAAIATPEIYVGVITETVEAERDTVMREDARLAAEVEALKSENIHLNATLNMTRMKLESK